jgi:hypothetical protein
MTSRLDVVVEEPALRRWRVAALAVGTALVLTAMAAPFVAEVQAVADFSAAPAVADTVEGGPLLATSGTSQK